MNIGDLVEFKPAGKLIPGALTAVKYFERMRKYSNGKPGIIISISGTNCSVMFGENIVIINENHLEVINKNVSK